MADCFCLCRVVKVWCLFTIRTSPDHLYAVILAGGDICVDLKIVFIVLQCILGFSPCQTNHELNLLLPY